MASLYRPVYSRKDPATGKVVKGRLAKWYGKYRDANGKERRVPLSTNKTAAQMMLADLVKQAELGRAHCADPYERHRRRPLTEHLADWEAELRARNNTAAYVKLKIGRCRRVLEGCGFVWIADLSASRVETWLADARGKGLDLKCGRGAQKGRRVGQQTSNHYLGAVKEFALWLVDDERTDRHPLKRLSGGNVDLDRRHVRRDLSEAELSKLLGLMPARNPMRGLSGADRRMLYLVSLYTGLRASELASLTPASFDLGAAPIVTVQAGYSKRRRRDVLPLHPAVVAELTPWLASKAAGAPLWPGEWAKWKEAGVMFRADLKATGVEYKTAAGLADFHSLRHTFITRVVKSGATPKEAQELARHSDIRLTLERYAHLGLLDLASAILRMPAVPAHIPESIPPAESA